MGGGEEEKEKFTVSQTGDHLSVILSVSSDSQALGGPELQLLTENCHVHCWWAINVL
jgi:hypothetical protein